MLEAYGSTFSAMTLMFSEWFMTLNLTVITSEVLVEDSQLAWYAAIEMPWSVTVSPHRYFLPLPISPLAAVESDDALEEELLELELDELELLLLLFELP